MKQQILENVTTTLPNQLNQLIRYYEEQIKDAYEKAVKSEAIKRHLLEKQIDELTIKTKKLNDQNQQLLEEQKELIQKIHKLEMENQNF